MACILLNRDKVQRELKELQALSVSLNGELFEQCCLIQKDANSVDFQHVSLLVEHSKTVEEHIGVLRQLLVELPLAAGASNAG